MKKSILILFVLCLAYLMLTTLAFGQAMPAPGTVIDKSNYKQYAHLIPKEFLQGFEDGFGFWTPFVMKVVEWRKAGQPKSFLDLSERNRGKYSIDKEGFIAGGYDYVGLPFPDLSKDDKDFATKFMYNAYYKYYYEGATGPTWDCEKRRGEPITNIAFINPEMGFINRLIESPKPTYTTPLGYFYALGIFYLYPNSYRNMKMLTIGYLDPRKSDEVYIYMPTMRRVIRGDASQRSTPIQGTTQAFDDFGGFAGKVQEFTYKLLDEQKVLGAVDDPFNIAISKKKQAESGGLLPFPTDGYSVRDVYVIEIKSRDHRYPQSRKVIYIDKENFFILYTMAWDRAGKLWKLWVNTSNKYPMPNGETLQGAACGLGIDLQVGYATSFTMDIKYFGSGLKYVDFLPTSLLKGAQ